MKSAALIAPVAVAFAPFAVHAHCFTLYDAKNTVVYQSSQSPLDLSRSISEQLTARFPNTFFVMSAEGDCVEINNTNSTTRAALPGIQRIPYATPLLRDAADVMNDRHPFLTGEKQP